MRRGQSSPPTRGSPQPDATPGSRTSGTAPTTGGAARTARPASRAPTKSGAGRSRTAGVVLAEGTEAIAAYEAARERHEEARARRRSLNARVSRLVGSIQRAWLDRAERAAYERFLEDYADPERWEGHRKTLTIAYPHRGNGLRRLVELLVEAGADPRDGTTVGEARALAEELGREVGFDVPEDLADLGFSVPGDEG